MLDGEATEEQLMAEMEQCEAYLRRFTGLRLQVGKLLKPLDEQSVDGDTGKFRKCRSRLKCVVCGSSHVPLMCLDLPSKKLQKSSEETEKHSQGVQKDESMANLTGEHVFLQVLRVVIRGTSGTKTVRAFVDTGSTKSYISKSVVSNLNLQPKRAQKITHCLFGGLGKDEMHYVVPDKETLNKFIRESVCSGEESVAALGLRCFPVKDVFTLNPDLMKTEKEDVVVTKRKLLSWLKRCLTP
ncbi:hypothetical protein JTB14_007116 [Gonioctena quinquepunctata]|nr:hypothetical protein JTB14_007116 [Gonioctena quinquepunctata]